MCAHINIHTRLFCLPKINDKRLYQYISLHCNLPYDGESQETQNQCEKIICSKETTKHEYWLDSSSCLFTSQIWTCNASVMYLVKKISELFLSLLLQVLIALKLFQSLEMLKSNYIEPKHYFSVIKGKKESIIPCFAVSLSKCL